ncbi:MAG: ligase-associated DNA damage response exonuclease [Bacteroidota bacterium]
MALLEFTKKGIFCPQANVYIDPWRPVDRALITHGHADHSRFGHKSYLCTTTAKPVIRYRLGPIAVQTIDYGKEIDINGVKVSFHPAGHIIGSAQIRLEYKGEVWCVSGDYKIENDGLSEAFEPVKCHAFITESTFGLPVYTWQDQATIFKQINDWWRQNKAEGKVSLLTAYALGKAQRLIYHLDESIGTIYTHGAVENVNEVIRQQGIHIKPTTRVRQAIKSKAFIGNIIIAPPGAVGSPWVRRFKPLSVGMASGWMSLRGARRRRAADRGFVLSDHADWEGLNQAIAETGAERVFVTHGYTEIFKRWLRDQGYDAHIVATEFEGELSEMNSTEGEEQEA